jgi:hypothetical protein
MSIAILLAFAMAIAGTHGTAGRPATHLTIAVYPQGPGQPGVRRYTLGCAPAAGTVPRPGRACRKLLSLASPFAPVPAGTICSDIVMGPQEAVVTGRVGGKAVHAHLSLRGSCEINRWSAVSAVVPGFPRPGP